MCVSSDLCNRRRRGLDLFANVVHVTSLPGCETRHKDVDIVIIRESTEGEYSCLEHEVSSIIIISFESALFLSSRGIIRYTCIVCRHAGVQVAWRQSAQCIMALVMLYTLLCLQTVWFGAV